MEIELNKAPATLIVGKNGSGKTTMLDALSFVLFGKPYRNINKPLLINSINRRECLVEIEFRAGRSHYKVVRGMKPSVFEIYKNNKLIEQDARALDYQDQLEKSILTMNFKTFKQIVIQGQKSSVPFMRLTAADRRDIIEDLLDIQIFSYMNVIVKQKMVELNETVYNIENDINVIDVKIESNRKYLEELKTSNEARIEKNLDELTENKRHKEEAMAAAVRIQQTIDELSEKITDVERILDKRKKLHELEVKIDGNLNKFQKEIKFYETNDNCPTCHQDIDETFKQCRIAERQNKLGEMRKGLDELGKQLNIVNERLDDIQGIQSDIRKEQIELVKINTSIAAINKYINKLQDEIKILKHADGPNTEITGDLEALEKEKDLLAKKKEKVIEDSGYYEIAASLLKDTGIKTKIIRQYLPIINKQINKYLGEMDFFVNFTLDENFTESIKSRFRDEFAYESFSDGEKQKIDLALLFTWRDVAKIKNSINTNLLIFDEVFDSSLDTDATEDLFKILNILSQGSNLFIISHKEDILVDKFSSVIRFNKVNNFSQMVT